MSTPNRLGAPIKQGESSRPPPPSSAPPPPPPPVIPASWLEPHEQRWLFVALFGLIEVTKTWDVVAPYLISYPEPTWSSALKVRGFWTFWMWTLFESGIFAGVSLLRIPMLSPSGGQLWVILVASLVWNTLCLALDSPGGLLRSIHLLGPTALGAEWYWNWYYALRRWREPSHLAGVHKIRLLPYSTATLNPLSLTYCIPHDSNQPLYIPIVFNNSIPDEIAYSLRSLETGLEEVKTIYAERLKKGSRSETQRLLTNGEEDDETDESSIPDPLSAVVLRSADLDVAKLPSVRPSDSLSLAPPKLSSSQAVYFLHIDRPAVISLKSAVDKAKNGFQIVPHREAVVIECPHGGEFVSEQNGQLVLQSSKTQPALLRCQGEEEVVQFQARGVAPLKASWKRELRGATTHGTIEGIEDPTVQDRVARTHTVPLRVRYDQPGIHKISLTSISDSMHNSYTPTGRSTEKTFNVIPRPSAVIGCSSPREMLIGGSVNIPVMVDGLSSEPVEYVYSFQPIDGDAWNKTQKVGKKAETIVATEPGVYTLLELKGPCGGSIMEPSSCTVQLVPKPSLDMQIETLHECAMDVGAKVRFDFSGIPPFTVQYTEQRNKQKAVTRTAKFNAHTGEITFKPNYEGDYTYNFISLGDAKYSQVKLDQPPVKQTVHPLASVDLLDGQAKQRQLYACSGDEVEVKFEARGAGILNLNYHVNYNGIARNETWQGPAGEQSMMVRVPEELSQGRGGSGKFSISFLSITDGNACPRKLSSGAIEVNVDRRRPTARFAKGEKLIITEGESRQAPLRLTGTGPWEVTYSLNDVKTRVTMRDPNNALTLANKGVYKLESVKNAHCPGTILDGSTYEIDFTPKPTVRLAPQGELGSEEISESTEVCAGGERQTALSFTGQAPFELTYIYTTNGGKTSRHVLKSAQDTGVLHLATEPGAHRYDLVKLSDANYASIPVELWIDHQVDSRPTISFAKLNTRSICVDAHLTGDAKLSLTGKAPFEIGLSVRRPGSSRLQHFTEEVDSNEWTLDLPYEARDVGLHEVSVTSFKDSSRCQWERSEKDVLSTMVEVVESANIVPIDANMDLCVGDTLNFALQGKAPWTIEYKWLGKKHKVSSSASRFSRYAEYPGSFSVQSVSLKNDQCKRQINDMERIVHPLPSVRIQEGSTNLREDDSPARFSVSFTGTAPFSFSYTRSELVGTKWKVMETQTVTDIMEDSYSIESNLPGDYAVTSVSDRYCRYPPLSRSREKS